MEREREREREREMRRIESWHGSFSPWLDWIGLDERERMEYVCTVHLTNKNTTVNESPHPFFSFYIFLSLFHSHSNDLPQNIIPLAEKHKPLL